MRAAVFAIAIALLGVGRAHADFASASVAYDRKDFPAALREFQRLAEQGEADAQYDLALMLINADGAPKDVLAGYGWVLAAQDNGVKQATSIVNQLRAVVTPAQTQAAEEYVTRYGRAAMTPPRPDLFLVSFDSRPRNITRMAFTFPLLERARETFGWVDAVYVIGTDGQIHDSWSGTSMPPGTYDQSVHAALVDTKFAPGMHDGKATAVLGITRVKFGFAAESIRDHSKLLAYIGELRKKADGGDADAQYVLATFGVTYRELTADIGDPLEWRRKAAAAGHVGAEFDLGLCELVRVEGCRALPAEGVQLLAQAARQGSGTAVVLLAFVCAAENSTAGDIRAIRWLQMGAATGQGPAVKWLADFLASSPHDEIRDAEGAERLAKRLRESALYKGDPDIWQISAAAAAARQDFRSALAFQDKALERAAALDWPTQALRERREAYAAQRDPRGYVLDTRLAFSQFIYEGKSKICETEQLGSRLADCY
jgi:TPR repeat protein